MARLLFVIVGAILVGIALSDLDVSLTPAVSTRGKSPALAQLSTPPILKKYSLEEVSKMNGEDGKPLCVLFHGAVIDVTHFLNTHPGGKMALLEHAGRDATEAILASGMPRAAYTVMKKLQVGQIAKGTRIHSHTHTMGDIKQFTYAEVAKHTGRNGTSLWVVYKDDVLDLTDFQNEHPGGTDTIQDEAGKDCTKAFDEVGHSGDAKKMMQKYKIGEIVQEERKYINGKRIVKARSGDDEGRSCISIVTCGLLGG